MHANNHGMDTHFLGKKYEKITMKWSHQLLHLYWCTLAHGHRAVQNETLPATGVGWAVTPQVLAIVVQQKSAFHPALIQLTENSAWSETRKHAHDSVTVNRKIMWIQYHTTTLMENKTTKKELTTTRHTYYCEISCANFRKATLFMLLNSNLKNFKNNN